MHNETLFLPPGTLIRDTLSHITANQRVSSGNLLVTNYLTEYLVLRCLLWWPTIKWELVIS